MPFTVGVMLGLCEIVAPLGSGGMEKSIAPSMKRCGTTL